MKTEFTINTDDTYPVHGTLEVSGTKAQLIVGRTFGAYTDANEVEHLARLLLSAAETMRRNGSCPDCGGNGYVERGADSAGSERCGACGVTESEGP